MTDTILTLVPEAATHPLMAAGGYALTPSATSSTSSQIVCSDLLDSSGAQSYTGWTAYCYSSVTATVLTGQARRVQSVDLSTGTLTLNRAYSRVTDASDLFWLLRNFSRDDWAAFANQSLREMKRRVLVTTPGLGGNVLRYSPPAGVVRPEDVLDVGIRSYPEVTTDGQSRWVRWFDWEDNDGTLFLVIDQPVATTQELVFRVLKPFATAGQNVLSSDSATTTAPRDWLVAEMVARALLSLWSLAVDEDKAGILPRLSAAGRLVAGFRTHYGASPPRRVFAPDAYF